MFFQLRAAACQAMRLERQGALLASVPKLLLRSSPHLAKYMLPATAASASEFRQMIPPPTSTHSEHGMSRIDQNVCKEFTESQNL